MKMTDNSHLNSMHFSPSDMGIDVASSFENIIRNESNLATAIAAQRTLILVLEKCSARTLQELVKLLKQASDQMKNVDCSISSVVSGCELFLRFITLASKLEEGTFEFEYQAPCLFSLLNLSILFSLLNSPQLWFCSTGNVTWHCTHYICIEQEKLKRFSSVTIVQ